MSTKEQSPPRRSTHSPMDKLPTEINIISPNCWGLKFISTLRTERLLEIGRSLAAADPAPHIVCLQECWCQEDYEAIRRQTRAVLPYGKFYYSGVFGSGLVILSRWPIVESSMLQYSLNGRPTAFFRGDWYVGKGVACAKIRYGPGNTDVVEVFNTHTHANYESKVQDSYHVHRLSQTWELTKLLRGAAERGHLVVACGDFNVQPCTLEYRLLTSNAPVLDVWRTLHPDSSLGPHSRPPTGQRYLHAPVPAAHDNLVNNGVTSNSVYNTWRWPRSKQRRLVSADLSELHVPHNTPDPRGQRIDYVLVGDGSNSTGIRKGTWTATAARVGMTDLHPTLHCSLSDHFSVEATLVFRQESASMSTSNAMAPDAASASQSATGDPKTLVTNGTYLQSPVNSSFHTASPRPSTSATGGPELATPLSPMNDTDYASILVLVRAAQARAAKQQRWRSVHFAIAVLCSLACHVGVWFSPYGWLSFLLMLISTLGLAVGAVDGLMALMFFRGSETRALQEFAWEMTTQKALTQTEGGSDVGGVGDELQDPKWEN